MNDNLGNLLLYLVGILIVGTIPTVYFLIRARQQGKSWESLAARLGLTLDTAGGEPALSGSYRGRGVRAEAIRRRSGNLANDYTVLTVSAKTGDLAPIVFSSVPTPLSAKDRERVRSLEGYRDTKDMGDAEFDRRYIVRAAEAEPAQRLTRAGSPFRPALENLLAMKDTLTVTLDHGALVAEQNGRQSNEARLLQAIDAACDAAEALEASN